MKVELIAYTAFVPPARVRGTGFGNRYSSDFATAPSDALAEFAGRLCYDSYHLPNDKTATNEGYLNNIINQRHFSVLEHGSATFHVEGVSRNLLMEFRTHRHTSFSARSTRYVDETESGIAIPPALLPHLREYLPDADMTVLKAMDGAMKVAFDTYEDLFNFLRSKGATVKEAREAAREVLPGATLTEFVVTANHAAWRELLPKRMAPGAAAEIRQLATAILTELKQIAPNTYQDIPCP